MKINNFPKKGKSLIYFTTNLARRLVNIYFPFKCNSHPEKNQELKPSTLNIGGKFQPSYYINSPVPNSKIEMNYIQFPDICNFHVYSKILPVHLNFRKIFYSTTNKLF